MSLSAGDLVRLPWEDRFTLAGALHTCRSLPGWRGSHPRPSLDDLRRRAAQAGAELALRAWLERRGIPYHLAPAVLRQGSLPRLVLWGHRLWLHLALVGSTPGPAEDTAAGLLAGQAEVPDALLDSAGAMPEDLFLFACLVGEPTRRRPDLRRRAAQVHLPACGQISLPARAEGLRYLHTRRLPEAAVVLRRERTPEWVVSPGRWHDLWLDDPGLFLLGWTTRREFRRQAHRLTDGRARWAMPNSLLRPIAALLSARQI